jgi:large subunit ribosomal protein L25
MAQSASLEATTRSATGKGAARSLRRSGRIPGVIYGHNREPEALVVDGPALQKLLQNISASSTMLDVTIDGRAPVKALLREIQRDPVKPVDILHVDFYEVQADERITVDVPVHLTGTADGVRNFGGVLDHVLYALEIEVLPGDLPEHIEIDVSHLGVGDSIFVRDVQVPNAEVLNDPGLPVCTVVAPRVEEAPAAAEAGGEAEPELIRKPKAEGEEPEGQG